MAEVIAGQSPKSEFYNKECEGIPFFQGKADFGEKFPTVSTWCTKPTKIAKEGDILFSVRAPVGPTNIAKLDCCVGRGLAAIRVSTQIDRSYLRYYFKKVEQKISDSGRGSTFNSITQKDLKSLQIPLPSLSEQRAIVERLDRAQRLIDIDREMHHRYDALIQSVFLEMFGDPVRNPKGWEVRKLGDVCEKITDGTHHSPPAKDEGVPYITAKHVKPFVVDFYAKPTFIDKDEHRSIYQRCNPELGDVLLIKDGATTGNAAINPYDFEFSMLSSLALIKTSSGLLTGSYLITVLNDSSYKEFIRQRYLSGVAIQRYTLKKIKQFEIPVPDLKLQKKYDQVFIKINQEKVELKQKLIKSESLFSSLVQQAFSKN